MGKINLVEPEVFLFLIKFYDVDIIWLQIGEGI